MRLAPTVLGVLAVLLTCGPGAAATAAAAGNCLATAQSQQALTACAGAQAAQAAQADRQLNAAYRDLLRYVDGDERARLVAAEKAWLAFRDQDCAFFGDGGGSIAPMNQPLCRASLSRARAKQLNGWPPNAPRSALAAKP